MADRVTNPIVRDARRGEQGFLLVGVIVMVALVLLALSVAAPIVAKDLQRQRELEAVHRGQQYTHAIRLYYRKFNAYPASMKVLEGGAPLERFLRQHYLDPMTGKDDWRLIPVGQAKTTVKGFFGEPLVGIAGAGLGSASGLQSNGVGAAGNTGGTTGGAAGGTSTAASVGPGQPGDSTSGATGGPGTFGSSSFGQTNTSNGATGSSQSATAFSGSSGPFVGIGVPKDGASIIVLNEQPNYGTWEFIYDPRIELMYAKVSLFGGGIASSSGGLGSASSLSNPPGSTTPTSTATTPGNAPTTPGSPPPTPSTPTTPQ